jgi:hypothetical protein
MKGPVGAIWAVAMTKGQTMPATKMEIRTWIEWRSSFNREPRRGKIPLQTGNPRLTQILDRVRLLWQWLMRIASSLNQRLSTSNGFTLPSLRPDGVRRHFHFQPVSYLVGVEADGRPHTKEGNVIVLYLFIESPQSNA